MVLSLGESPRLKIIKKSIRMKKEKKHYERESGLSLLDYPSPNSYELYAKSVQNFLKNHFISRDIESAYYKF